MSLEKITAIVFTLLMATGYGVSAEHEAEREALIQMNARLTQQSKLNTIVFHDGNDEEQLRVFEVGEHPRLIVKNLAGNIQVNRGDHRKIRVRYQRSGHHVDVWFRQRGDEVRVETRHKLGHHNHGEVSFEIEVPWQSDLDLRSFSGSMTVLEIEGYLRTKTMSGDIEIEQCSGDLEISTFSGDIELLAIGDAWLEAGSMSGDISYSEGLLSGGQYRFETFNGHIHISHDINASYEIHGQTLTGDIRNEVSEDFDIDSNIFSWGKTISGSYNGGENELSIQSLDGDITLRVE